MTAKCRICDCKRKAPASSTSTSVASSAEDIVAERAGLHEAIRGMLACGAEPTDIAKYQAKLANLDAPLVQASPPDVVAQLKDATGAQAAATAYYDS